MEELNIPYSEEELFNLVKWIGKGREKKFEILDISEGDSEAFRVYHNDCYCFEVAKSTNNDNNHDYSFSQTWDGFKNDLTPLKAAQLLLESENT